MKSVISSMTLMLLVFFISSCDKNYVEPPVDTTNIGEKVNVFGQAVTFKDNMLYFESEASYDNAFGKLGSNFDQFTQVWDEEEKHKNFPDFPRSLLAFMNEDGAIAIGNYYRLMDQDGYGYYIDNLDKKVLDELIIAKKEGKPLKSLASSFQNVSVLKVVENEPTNSPNAKKYNKGWERYPYQVGKNKNKHLGFLGFGFLDHLTDKQKWNFFIYSKRNIDGKDKLVLADLLKVTNLKLEYVDKWDRFQIKNFKSKTGHKVNFLLLPLGIKEPVKRLEYLIAKVSIKSPGQKQKTVDIFNMLY